MIRVLYSFPWSIGQSGINYTAWEQVSETCKLGVDLSLIAGNIHRAFEVAPSVCKKSMSLFGRKLPAKLLGGVDNAATFHDRRVAKWIKKHHRNIDVLHCWPCASKQSIITAQHYGITTFLERPNTHTEFAYEAVKGVYQTLGIPQPGGASHTFKQARLDREIEEFKLTDYLLCPSPFVAKSFTDRGFPEAKILLHQYGYSPSRIQLNENKPDKFSLIFIGNDAPRKGLHNILRAWSDSDASASGEFHIFGKIDDDYLAAINELLKAPGVKFHGFSPEIQQTLADSHCFVLSSYEEGSALVTYEARAAGCVLLVSDAVGAVVENGVNGLMHKPGDIDTLKDHINLLYRDKSTLEKLRKNSVAEIDKLTWSFAAEKLVGLYEQGHAKRRGSND